MEAALVSVAMGVMKPLLSKLSRLLEEECANQKSVRRNTKFLRDEMGTMSATLQILADSEELDPQMKIWRDDVRELSYDMEDCVDDIMSHELDGPLGLKAIYDWFKKLKPRHEIGDKIKQLKTRASEASERHKRYNVVQSTAGSSICAIDPRLPAFYEEVDNLVGIDGPKKHVIEWLKKEGSSTELKVLSIAGPGGLGKTTLANQVFATIQSQFSCAAFVSVSRVPNMKKVLRDIAKGVGITDNTSDDDVKQLIDRLREHLKDERYFIVIDDIWDTRAWETIRLALLNNNLGCRIITTTRNITIAACASQGGYVYQMEPLSFADSKRLFFKRAFDSVDLCYPHLAEVSKGILEKCAGLPLAIITMSSLLADQLAEDEWKRVLTAIGSALANDPNAGNMTKILSLSYYDLPQHLRTCLLYFSVFPEDCRINKQNLISRWIAEGFIHNEQRRCTYEVGEDYFNDLINRSLIQPVDVKYGQAEACQVHDIILDFITCKAAEENFVTSFGAAEHGHISGYKVRRLCVENRNNEKVTVSTRLDLSHVRSLTTFGCFVPNSLLAFPVLRVLDLGECLWLKGHHLANIEKLFLLKYLRLGNSSITELPRKIGELQYLETLDIRSTMVQELPSTITRLRRLTRLYVHRRTRFPHGVIGQMQSLEELDEFGVLSYAQECVKSLQEFGQLTKLRRLKVICSGKRSQADNLRNCLGTLISSCNLYHLYILYAYHIPVHRRLPLPLESWCPTTPCTIQKLHITYGIINKVPNWMRSLGNLRDLELSIFSMTHEDIAILGAIPTLLLLKLETLYGANGRIFIRGFRSLKYFSLRIFYCGTSLEFEAGSMPKLDHFKLEFCGHDACDFGIHHLSALTKVEVVINKGDLHSADTVGTLVTTAIETLPNHPTLSFVYQQTKARCVHFGKFVESYEPNKEGEEEEEEEE